MSHPARVILALLPALLAVSVSAKAQGFSAVDGAVTFPAISAGGASQTAAARRWRSEVARRTTAAGLRRLAEGYEAARLYQQAADTYRREAALRRRQGDVNAAIIEAGKANWLDSRVVLYREQAVRDALNGPAKSEPASGCYAGAILTGDNRFPEDFEGFNGACAKHHPASFDYHHFGTRFPARWVAKLKAAGAAAQLAFEPTAGLDVVRDDAYLQEFARQVAASGVPIFLRYAAETNGDWTRYGGKGRERAYIQKWRPCTT